jgi:hypothetical protein
LRIDGSSRTSSVSARGGVRGGASSGIFQLDSGAPAARAATVSSTAPAQGIEALLALQAVEDPIFAKKKAIRRGKSLLDTLDDIKADLLVGHVSEGRLNLLMAIVGQAREKSEPGLDRLLDDIELRVRVELAKFGRFPGR